MSEEKKEPNKFVEGLFGVLPAIGWSVVFLLLLGVLVAGVASGVTMIVVAFTGALSGWYTAAAGITGVWLTGTVLVQILGAIYRSGKKAGEKSVRGRLFR